MAFKKRATERRTVTLDVYITHKLEYTAVWKTKDLSLHGALIDMAQGDLAPNCDVEAILAVKSKGREQRHHIAARIVRVSARGVALRFSGYGNQTHTALTRLLYVKPKEFPAAAGLSAGQKG
ncbi:MAG: PilZ domain-containing protein [Acidiferrobacterales bacterium]